MQAETQAQMQAEAQTRAEGGQDPLSGQLPGQAPGSTGGRVRVYIDSWDPSYGSGLETSDAPTGESSAPVKLDIETPPESWQPLSPPPDLRAPDSVLFVDGVRRIDTNLWVEEADGTLLPGIAASYAAGVVRCDLRGGRADVVSAQVERGLFTPSAHAVGLSCGNTRYEVRRAAVEDPAQLSQAVQPCLQRLEVDVSNRARAGSPSEDDLLVLDGRLRDRSTLPRALGYIKTHHQQYLPADLAAVVRGLRPGQRTPVFLLGTRWQNYTWYLKLPGPAGSPWAGVVRLEASADLTRPDVIRLADLSTITLPRFASTSYKDSRAPQNLTPIAGLERRLRGMLGDQRLLLRSLTAAAAAQHHPAAAAAQHHPAAAAAQPPRGGSRTTPPSGGSRTTPHRLGGPVGDRKPCRGRAPRIRAAGRGVAWRCGTEATLLGCAHDAAWPVMHAVTGTRRLPLPDRYDFAGTVSGLMMSRHDPCFRITDGAFWWATRTPTGPGTLSLRRSGRVMEATAYGPGGEWLLEQSDAVAGLRDDQTGFVEVASRHPVVARLAHLHGGLRLPATGRIFQRLLRAVFEQKVTGTEAYRAYAATVRHFHLAGGREPAPGPVQRLLLPPDPEAVAATPYWIFHPFGVEQRRADTLCRAAAVAARLEDCTNAADATRRLTAINGIGPWTAAEVVRVAFGDPDVVSVGDFHHPHMVSWALAGEARAGAREGAPGMLAPADVRMLELLEPFQGHRGRVCLLLIKGGLAAPKFGPRMPIRSFAAY